MRGEYVVTYECHVSGETHAIPGPNVRVMKIGDGGFVVACDCGPEDLEDVDEPPHPTEDHIANIYGRDPKPAQWLELEDAADGWYDATRWDAAPEDFDGTLGQRRAKLRKKVEALADSKDENKRGGADETDRQARAVPCPQCEASAGEKCYRPSGHRVRKSHADRKEKARETGELDDGDDGREPGEQSSLEGWV